MNRKIKDENVLKITVEFKDGEKERFKRYLTDNALKIGGFVRLLILEAMDKPATTQIQGLSGSDAFMRMQAARAGQGV